MYIGTCVIMQCFLFTLLICIFVLLQPFGFSILKAFCENGELENQLTLRKCLRGLEQMEDHLQLINSDVEKASKRRDGLRWKVLGRLALCVLGKDPVRKARWFPSQ